MIADSKGDIQRGLEVIEFCCGIPHVLKGEYTQGAGPGIDVYSMRQPLGIGAGITPFNFPAMIPLWMFGVAIATGNAFILKPSERDPSVPVRLAELFTRSRAARGHPPGRPRRQGDGRRDPRPSRHRRGQLRRLVRHRALRLSAAASPTASACRRWAAPRTTASSCPTPTSTRSSTTSPARPSARPASAAWRCRWSCRSARRPPIALREKLIPAIAALRVGVSTDADAHYGPVVTPRTRQKVENWIQTGVDEGAELVVDGRGFTLQGHEEGFFIGPTLFDHVTADMKTYQEEIFGPVLQIVRADDFEEALRAAERAPVRQRRRHLHPQRPRRARIRRAGQCRHGRHQRADPGAGRLSQLRRLEALRLRRHQPARHGRRAVLDQGQDRHPALARGGVGDGANAFVIPTMG